MQQKKHWESLKRFKTLVKIKRWCCFCRTSESLLTFVNTLGPNGRAGLNWLVTNVPNACRLKMRTQKKVRVKAIVCSKHVTYLRKHSKDKLFSIQLRFLEHHWNILKLQSTFSTTTSVCISAPEIGPLPTSRVHLYQLCSNSDATNNNKM